MERRHQVFVSSTYEDLKPERQQVIHALLELDCIPAGMELFPAADEDAWSLITGVINDSDYYILILAGKYGTPTKGGISFTEKEYDYAVSVRKPVIAFLYDDFDKLPAGKCEKNETQRKRLQSFIEKVKKRHCKFWSSAEDLGGKVSRSLIQLRKKHPSDGWIPGRFAADESLLNELHELRTRVAQLEYESATSANQQLPGTKSLAQGDEEFPLWLKLRVDNAGKEEEVALTATWDTIFAYLGPPS